jgi:hypothetical protein
LYELTAKNRPFKQYKRHKDSKLENFICDTRNPIHPNLICHNLRALEKDEQEKKKDVEKAKLVGEAKLAAKLASKAGEKDIIVIEKVVEMEVDTRFVHSTFWKQMENRRDWYEEEAVKRMSDGLR